MDGNASDKVFLVTGGSSGIGKASALTFAREGARVAIADVDVDGGQETIHEIKEMGGQAIFVKTDVSKATEVESMIAKVVESYGQLDYAFNNAGVLGDIAPIAECSEENWDRVTSIHLKGVFLCLKYEIRQMHKQGGGAIVNTASVMGKVASGAGASAYVASKHGIIGLTKAAALECAQSGIRVNAVCPGFIRTPMVDRLTKGDADYDEALTARHPVGHMGAPNEVAEAVLWLCSDAASFVTGQALAVDGGYLAQ